MNYRSPWSDKLAKRTYSTLAVAAMIPIAPTTLHRWIAEGKIRAPRLQIIGGQKIRAWTVQHIERLRAFKQAHYREGSGIAKKEHKEFAGISTPGRFRRRALSPCANAGGETQRPRLAESVSGDNARRISQ